MMHSIPHECCRRMADTGTYSRLLLLHDGSDNLSFTSVHSFLNVPDIVLGNEDYFCV